MKNNNILEPLVDSFVDSFELIIEVGYNATKYLYNLTKDVTIICYKVATKTYKYEEEKDE